MTFDPKWDEKYGVPEYLFGREPNDYLRSQLWRLPKGGRVLAIGDGEGRNSVWLASKGLSVAAVEGSHVAVAKARALAAEAGVEVSFHTADLLKWSWPKAAFDVVLSVFVHFQPEARRAVHAHVDAALKPGGLFVVEGFHARQIERQSGGPPFDMLYDAPSLHADFPGYAVVELFEGVVLLDEGVRHQGLGEVVRMVARKPDRDPA